MDINFKEQEHKLLEELDVVLHTKYQPVIDKISIAGPFQDLLKKELNILFFMNKKNNSNSSACKKLLEKFNELSKQEFKIDNFNKINDFDQMVDDINYLSIYIKNIFKVDIKDLNKIDVKPAESVQVINEKDTQQTNPYASYMSAMGAAMNNPSFGNALLEMPARARLQAEIRNGTVFAFESKPKIIPLLKKILAIFLCLFTCSLLLTGIFITICGSFKNGRTDSGTDETNVLTNGIMYMLISLMFAYYCYRFVNEAYSKKIKNDNITYHLTFNLWLILFFSYLLIFLTDVFTSKYLGHVSFFDSFKFILEDNQNIVIPLWGWFVCDIISLSFFIFILILLIIAKIYNPRPDNKRMEELIKQYVDEMSRATPAQPPFN